MHFLAGQRRAGRDKAGVAAHELHEPDAVDRTAGFDVPAAERLLSDFEGRGEAERAKHVFDVVVDCLGNADDRDLEAAAGDLLIDLMRTALRAVAADAEEHVDALAMEEVDDDLRILRAARAAQGCAAQFVNLGDEGIGERNRREARGRVEAEIAVADAEHVAHAVVPRELLIDRADDVVEAGAEAAAGDDRGARVKGIEVDPLAWSGPLEEQILMRGFGRRVDLKANTMGAGNEVAQIRRHESTRVGSARASR